MICVISQVIFCGKGSNRTITHIINQSTLIDTYRSVHVNIEKNFMLSNTSRHAPTDMTNTLRELRAKIRSYNCHHLAPGSKVNAEVLNTISEGMCNYMPTIDEQDSNEKVSELEALEVEDLDAV